MTAPALWTKHRPVARAIAHNYRIPGLEPQDVEQEALIALWEAAMTYDKGRGTFPPYARTVIHRTLTDLLRTATREKRAARTVELEEVAAPQSPWQLWRVVEALPGLTFRERSAVTAHLNGTGDPKRDQNVLAAARRKLSEALAA